MAMLECEYEAGIAKNTGCAQIISEFVIWDLSIRKENRPHHHKIIGLDSEGQEKYFRELSITPVGYFTGAIKNHSRAVSHRNYFAWRK
jgi:hypothetical protein